MNHRDTESTEEERERERIEVLLYSKQSGLRKTQSLSFPRKRESIAHLADVEFRKPICAEYNYG